MDIKGILNRLDIEAIQDILGREVIGTLNQMGPQYSYSTGLLKILTNNFSFAELLKNPISRNHIIDALRENEIKVLSENLNISFDHNIWGKIKSIEYKGNSLLKLFNFFEIELINETENEWVSEYIIKPSYPLYPYQRNVLEKINSVLNTEKNRVLLHMPTGSGKTRTTISFVCRYLIENKDKNVVWFANTVELLDQAFHEFQKAWSTLGDSEIKAIKFWGKSKIDISTLKGSFIVAGLDKTYNFLLQNVGKMSVFSNNCSLVIMDEAHQAIAPTYSLLIESLLVVNKSSLIGLSATPGRTWNSPDEDRKLSDFFYRQKAKIVIDGFENPVDYLIEKKYLAKTEYTKLFYNGGLKLSEEDLIYLKENFVFSNDVLKSISEDRLRNLTIISKVRELIKKHQRIILFAITKPHAILLNSLLTALDINSLVVTSDTSSKERSEIINYFKLSRNDNPESIVLCNYGILTTGFDAPETSCAVIARPTDSLVLYSQMVGRAIRGLESGGNDVAEIVTVIDSNLPGFGDVAEAFVNWDDVWKDI